MYNGIDVSKWQGKINWSKAKKYIDFAIIRAGYGKGNVDEYANYNIEQCEKYKIPYGLYWFSYAYNKDMAEREADYLLRVIGYHKPEYPLYFDFEYDSVDYAILKDVKKGDLVITQDYGEAGMLLTKGAIVVHPSGFIVDSNNIDSLLMTRYINGKMRKHQLVKGPKKRTQDTRKRFLKTIEGIISNEI